MLAAPLNGCVYHTASKGHEQVQGEDGVQMKQSGWLGSSALSQIIPAMCAADLSCGCEKYFLRSNMDVDHSLSALCVCTYIDRRIRIQNHQLKIMLITRAILLFCTAAAPRTAVIDEIDTTTATDQSSVCVYRKTKSSGMHARHAGRECPPQLGGNCQEELAIIDHDVRDSARVRRPSLDSSPPPHSKTQTTKAL